MFLGKLRKILTPLKPRLIKRIKQLFCGHVWESRVYFVSKMPYRIRQHEHWYKYYTVTEPEYLYTCSRCGKEKSTASFSERVHGCIVADHNDRVTIDENELG